MDVGYRIDYGGSVKKKPPTKKIALLFSAASIAALLIWPAGRRAVQKLLLPGDPEVTVTALQGLATDLGEGESVKEAVTAFCREIIADGQ